MSMDTRTATRTRDAQSPALHIADRHELIRVHGARVNNLRDVVGNIVVGNIVDVLVELARDDPDRRLRRGRSHSAALDRHSW